MAEDFAPLDRIDREILRILRDDARIPWSAVGDRVHLSPNAVADRVRRLRQRGILRRFTVDVDQAALGRDLEAVIDVSIATDPSEFIQRALERDEITWMGYITGPVDFRMNVSCAGTTGLDELLVFFKQIGARETNTTVVLRRVR